MTSAEVSLTVPWSVSQGVVPGLSIARGLVDENAGSITVRITLTPSSLQTVSVDYETSDGTATAGEDYTASSGTLTFTAGDTTKDVTVDITNDHIDEADENFKITLSNAVNAMVDANNREGAFTINDDDTAGVTVFESSLTIDEGSTGHYTVKLDSEPTANVTITVNAPTNTDVTAAPATLTFTAQNWKMAQEVTVTAGEDDDAVDDTATLTHTVSSTDSNYQVIVAVEVNVSVTDTDLVQVSISFENATYTVDEGDDVTVTVTLNADPERTVTIPLSATGQGGASDSDYSGVPASVTFDSGDTEKSFTFTAASDDVDDDDESVALGFGTLPDGVSAGSTDEATVSITDDDAQVFDPDAAYRVLTSYGSDTEIDLAGYLADGVTGITFTLESCDSARIDYYDSAAVAGGKLTLTSNTLGHIHGLGTQTETTCTVTGTGSVGSQEQEFELYTVSNRTPQPLLPGDLSLVEARTNELDVQVSVPEDSIQYVRIGWRKIGGGGPTFGVVSGVTEDTVLTIPELDKGARYEVRAYLMTYQSFDLYRVGSTGPDEALIADGGPAAKWMDNLNGQGLGKNTTLTARTSYGTSLSIADVTAPEGVGDMTFTVTLSESSDEVVRVDWDTSDGTATAPDDYAAATSRELTIEANEMTQTFTVAIVNDDVDESEEETFTVTLSNAVNADLGDATATGTITDDDVPSVTVSFGSSTYTVDEGDDVTVTVTLSAEPERGVTIPLTAIGQDGADADDYSGVPASLVFESGETEKSFTFTAAADDVDDDGESVMLGFGTLPDGVTAGATDEATVSITDDDAPAVTVSFGSSTYAVDEGDDVTVTVTLSADPERTVTIPLTKANQDGASSADYSGVPASVIFNSEDTEQSFTFTAASDDDNDDGESVKLGFGSTLPTGVSAGSTDETTVSITDDDAPAVTVSFGSSTYAVDEGDDVSVTVTLDADPERTVTIPLSATDQGGASDSDYSGVPASLVFESGDTEKSFTFTAASDDVDDDGESVKLTFGTTLPAGVSAGSTDETTVSITDDDAPAVTVSFGSSTYTVHEGDDVTVTVTLNADPERTVTIPLTKANQDGASTADYSGVPASVIFVSGDTEQSFTFTAASDDVDDDDESVTLSFGALPTGVSAGTTSETTVSITDDDAPAVEVSFGAATYTVDEGDDVTVTVTLSADPEREVTIPIAKTEQDGASGADYSGVPASVTFESGETEKIITFTAASDDVDDDGESVKLSFGALPTGVSAGTTSEATVSITDDDAPAVTVSFGSSTYTVDEGEDVSVTVTLSADPEREVTISLSAAGQGGADADDYSGVPASLTFDSGDTDQSFTFTAASDDVDDDDESVKLTFGTTLPAGVSAGSTDEATVSITDDDAPAVTVSFGSSTYTVDEGDDVTVKVTLSADPEREVTIPLSAAGQGGADADDYSGVPANVTFGSGDTDQSFTFTAASDDVDDDGESVMLTFGTLPVGVTKGDTDESIVSITDDDLPSSVTVEFEASTYSVTEGGDVEVTVTLNADPERSVTISLTKANQGGASDSDYSGVPSSVTFDIGETEKSFTFEAAQDNLEDSGESVKLGFGSTLPTGVSTGSTDEATVTITNVSAQNSLTVNFGAAAYGLTEGGTTTVAVTLSTAPGSEVTIPLTKSEQGGASSADYSGIPVDLTFGSGDTSKTFTFTATPDTIDDDGESVKLGFGMLSGGITAGSTSETTVSIIDDDDPGVKVRFGAASYAAAEGGTVEVTVELSADPERQVVVPLNKENLGGANGSDYSGVPQSVTFESGDTEKTFTFMAEADDEDDDGESVKLTFGTLPVGVTKGDTDESTVSITDDDAPAVKVRFGAASYAAAEGGTVEVTVELSADPERQVVVPLNKENLGGANGSDYSGVPASVTFDSGDTDQSFTFNASDDTDDDDGESVKLTFGDMPEGVTVDTTVPDGETVARDTATVSITDDDKPASVTVNFGESSYTVDEGGTVSVKVTLSEDPEMQVVVPLTATGRDGATAADYSGVPQSVTFESGDTEKTFTFMAEADDEDDDGESVKLTFGTLPVGVTKGDIDESTVSITDDDDPGVKVRFGAESYAAAEGGTVEVTVELSADPERQVVVPLNKENLGGANGSDYSGVPANVTFESGETEKSFTFTAAADDVDDDDESVKLTFGDMPEGVTVDTTVPDGETVARDTATVSITDDDVPSSVTVEFEASTYSVTEGGDVEVTVTLNVDPERSVTISLTNANQGGASDSDYSGVPSSVTFDSGETEKSFTFEAAQDNLEDSGESVKLGFGSTLPTGVSTGSTDEATVTITNVSAQNSLTVNFGAAAYGLTEGGTTTVAVTLSTAPGSEVTIPLTKAEQGGASSADYSGIPADLTFDSTDTSKTFTFTATPDTIDDDGESVKLGFGMLPGGITAGSTSETTVSITDDDDPGVKVSFEQGSYTVAEGNSVTVKVKLDADPERTVTIPLTATGQGGADADDYSGVPQSVTFESGDTEKTFSFMAEADDEDDDGESVKLTFGTLPTGVTKGDTDESTVSITDDDLPSSVTVEFESSTYSVTEGGDVEVTVTLDADPERTVTIPLTKANQDGASDSDYSGVPDSVTFESGDMEKSFTFTAASDDVDDDGESVALAFGAPPTGVSAGTTSETTVSITDDDTAGVTVHPSAIAVVSGTSNEYTVALDTEPTDDVTVNIAGFSGTDLSLDRTSLTFTSTDWKTAQTVTVFAASTATAAKVTLTHAVNSTSDSDYDAGTADDLSVTVLGATAQPQVQVGVSASDQELTVPEGKSKTYSLVLSFQPAGDVMIAIGGVTGTDLSLSDTTLTFTTSNWDTEQAVTVTAGEDDDAVDDTATLSHTVTSLADTAYDGAAAASVNVTVTDDDNVSVIDDGPVQVSVSFESATYAVAEDSSVTVTVTLDADPEREVTIPLTATGQGGADADDYSGVPDSVTFESGDTQKSFTFTAASDSDNDDGESVALAFGALPTGVSAGSQSTSTVSITDDDAPAVTVSFGSSTYTVDEGGDVTVTVTLDADPERTVTIPLSATGQGGASDSDYSGVPSSVVFDIGDTSKSFMFSAVADSADENDEQVVLGLGALPDSVVLGAINQAIVTVLDSPRVSFSTSEYMAHEGGDGADVVVQLAEAARKRLVIPLTATGGNGATSGDWTGVPSELVFATGDSSKTFTVMAYDDDVEDNGETVQLGFGTLPTGVVSTNPSTATIKLMNTEVESAQVCDNEANKIIVLDEIGEISESGESGFWEIELDPFRSFLIEAIGVDGRDLLGEDNHPGELTLEAPSILAIWNAKRTKRVVIFAPNSGGGYGENALTSFFSSGYGFRWIEIAGSDGGTGSYQIKMRVNNICRVRNDGEVKYPWFGGPEGYSDLDILADRSTDSWLPTPSYPGYAEGGNFLGDNWDLEPDEDWWEVYLNPAYEYTVEVHTETNQPERHQATQLKILGIYNRNGMAINGTASSGSGKSVSVVFRPNRKGRYYIAVGSEGEDRTGTYYISAAKRAVPIISKRALDVDEGASASYTVVLGVVPAGDVEVSIAGFAGADLSLDKATLTFTADNWETAQTVTVTAGEDGDEVDDTATLTHTIIPLGNPLYYYEYRNAAVASLKVTVTDGTMGRGANDETTKETDEETNRDADNGAAVKDESSAAPDSAEDPEPPPAPRNLTSVVNEDSSITLTWDAPDDDSVTGYQILRRRPSEGEDSLLIHVQDTGNTDTTYMDTDVTPDVRHIYRVKAINEAGSGERSNNAEAIPTEPSSNSPATGAPTISGTAQVGEALRADTSGINDADGLNNTSFSYQWLADDIDISGGTSSSYTLSVADEGKQVSVKVSFTDDVGYEETLFSTATAAVAAEPEPAQNSPATGAPTISGEARAGETLTAETSGIADEDGLTGVAYSYQWLADDTNIPGATGASYNLGADDEGKAIRVTVTFTDDADNLESLSSERTAAVAPKLNSPATGAPAITGMAQVGETLTADTSSIADADGLANVSY